VATGPAEPSTSRPGADWHMPLIECVLARALGNDTESAPGATLGR
jgi:hypothetical protein